MGDIDEFLETRRQIGSSQWGMKPYIRNGWQGREAAAYRTAGSRMGVRRGKEIKGKTGLDEFVGCLTYPVIVPHLPQSWELIPNSTHAKSLRSSDGGWGGRKSVDYTHSVT